MSLDFFRIWCKQHKSMDPSFFFLFVCFVWFFQQVLKVSNVSNSYSWPIKILFNSIDDYKEATYPERVSKRHTESTQLTYGFLSRTCLMGGDSANRCTTFPICHFFDLVRNQWITKDTKHGS